MKKFKYFGAYIIPLLGLITFNSNDIQAYFGLLFLYVAIPVLEFIFSPNKINLDSIEKELAAEDVYYDLVLFISVPLHLFVVYSFFQVVSKEGISNIELVAYILMMGTILGVNGINIGHELGHKTKDSFKTFLGHIMLLTAIQNHFIPYHNGGHHRDVGTPNDLSSAKEGDIFYFFALRSQIGGYFKAWRFEHERLTRANKNVFFNPMIFYSFLTIALFLTINYFYGFSVTGFYFLSAVYGISVLEAQNYFSHYGLRRKRLDNGRYERVNPSHSWNSDHIFGRVLLFELTRHSDHHHSGSKPYQILDSKEDSPTLPYGYPAMLILSYFPFIFIPLMRRHLNAYRVSK
ncbi:MAG: alkane 1-monooxygenase [Flavobacteriaceae bacterium]